MNFEVLTTDEFEKEVKRLSKKYQNIKKDILVLIEKLEEKAKSGVPLGGGLYKIRVRNSDVGGKRGGYRVIYYFLNAEKEIFLLAMYSKSITEDIDINALSPIIEKINNEACKNISGHDALL